MSSVSYKRKNLTNESSINLKKSADAAVPWDIWYPGFPSEIPFYFKQKSLLMLFKKSAFVQILSKSNLNEVNLLSL